MLTYLYSSDLYNSGYVIKFTGILVIPRISIETVRIDLILEIYKRNTGKSLYVGT